MNRLAANSRNSGRDKSTISVKSQRGSSRTKPPTSELKFTPSTHKVTSYKRVSSKKLPPRNSGSKQKLNKTSLPYKTPVSRLASSSPHIKPKPKLKKPSKSEKAAKQLLRNEYNRTAERVFKRIDFFNRDFIDASCINKWIDQRVLYFFGGLFHRIRSKKLQLSCKEFLQQAEKVFERSSLADVKDFVESMKNQHGVVDAATSLGADGKIAMTRGVAAVTQAAALPPTSTSRQRQMLRLGELDFQMDLPSTKQSVTPLFSQTTLAPRRIDSNIPRTSLLSVTCKPTSLKNTFQQTNLKHSFNDVDTKPEESKVEHRISLSSSQQSKQNIQRRQQREREEARFGRLQDRLDYFIQRNSEHLHVSQYVRQQHGY